MWTYIVDYTSSLVCGFTFQGLPVTGPHHHLHRWALRRDMGYASHRSRMILAGQCDNYNLKSHRRCNNMFLMNLFGYVWHATIIVEYSLLRAVS